MSMISLLKSSSSLQFEHKIIIAAKVSIFGELIVIHKEYGLLSPFG